MSETELERLQHSDYVYIQHTKLTELPELPSDIQILHCNHNELEQLPELMYCEDLHEIICSYNYLKLLPELPYRLFTLDCEYNQLLELPDLPTTLTSLICNHNQLLQLPELPTLTTLICNHNQLLELPELPTLHQLHCQHNRLTFLPVLHNAYELFCSYNQLTELPILPNSLNTIYCDHNYIEEIHVSRNVIILKCNHNNLKLFPKLPNGIVNLYLANNPFLKNPVELKKYKAYLKKNPKCLHDLVIRKKPTKYRTLNAREPVGQAKALTRKQRQFLYRNLPRKPVINTEDRFFEDRRFKPAHWATHYHGRERTSENRQSRRLRRRGVYPEATSRLVDKQVRVLGANISRSFSPPRFKSKPIRYILGTPVIPREDIMHRAWQQLQEELREQYEAQLRQQYQEQTPFSEYPQHYNSENYNSENY